jgi:hypothetical protein
VKGCNKEKKKERKRKRTRILWRRFFKLREGEIEKICGMCPPLVFGG